MNRRLGLRRRRYLAGCLVATAAVLASSFFSSSAGAQVPGVVGGGAAVDDGGPGRRTVPTDYYFTVLSSLYSGDYVYALKEFQACLRSAVKNGSNFWIDSICYHTMCGETYYQMGQNRLALDEFNKALTLAINFNDWMIPVRFSPTIIASQETNRPVPWGRTERRLIIGHFPDTALIRQGQVDQSSVVARGGLVQQAIDFPINPQEIARCICLAIRRRRDLLGPVAPHDTLNNQMITALSRRPVQPNHWTEAWIDVELGCAFAAADKDAQAKPIFEKAIITGGQFDHPLTSIALVELGRIALKAGDYDTATRYFHEASFSAFHFLDPLLIEDALRSAAVTHILANRPGVYLPATAAAEWARRQGFRQLQCQMIAMAAEGQCLADQPKVAIGMLEGTRTVTNRTGIMQSRTGAQLNYLLGLAQYQLGNIAAGDGAVNAALQYTGQSSIKLFHIGLTEQLVAAQALTLRMARDILAAILHDPLPADWLYDPLETMSVLVYPHPSAYELWFEASIESKELDYKRACEIADLAKRHKFLSSQEFGGRLLNLRWLLEGPPEQLSQAAKLQRQSFMTQFPAYEKFSQQARDLQTQISQLPLIAPDATAAKQRAAKVLELDKVCQTQEVLLRVMTLRRLPAELVFPPIRTVEEVQKSLGVGRGVMMFYMGLRGTYGFLMTDEKFGYWPLPKSDDILKQLVELLQGCGNYGENKAMRNADLTSTAWQKPARELFELLVRDSKSDLPYGFEELTIIPDGGLWYVPFEALLASPRGQAPQPLLTLIRMRYAPTLGLAVGDARPRLEKGKSMVTLGKLYPTDDEEVADQAFAEFSRAVPQSESFRLKPPLPTNGAIYASAADRLIAFTEILPSQNGYYQWNPTTGDRVTTGGTLNDWVRLPWHGPEQIALPGFRTAAEESLKKLNVAEAGTEIYFAVTGLLGSGARTVLISRWRPGGRTSYDLVREFMQELPYTSAAKSWQRSVSLVQQSPISPELEPRVNLEVGVSPPPPTHPFFWAPYLIVDTGSEPPEAVKEPDATDKIVPK